MLLYSFSLACVMTVVLFFPRRKPPILKFLIDKYFAPRKQTDTNCKLKPFLECKKRSQICTNYSPTALSELIKATKKMPGQLLPEGVYVLPKHT